ncbi:MAG TPA: S8 family serine peptidase [Vicinamibacterales bacterium]|nr:S8 family serine peptidase [Vicinamibacterales bacterium]
MIRPPSFALIVVSVMLWSGARPVETRRLAGAGLPILVQREGVPALITANDAGKFRITSAASRLPPVEAGPSVFAAAEVGPSDRLLAEADGRVFSYAPRTGEIASFDVATGRTTAVLAHDALPMDCQDFELTSGGLAVLGCFGATTRVIVLQLRTADNGVRTALIRGRIDVPFAAVDLAISSRGLLLLSETEHALLDIPNKELLRPSSAPDANSPPQFTKLLVDLPIGARAVAEWRDILYVSYGRLLLVVPRDLHVSGRVVPVPAPLDETDSLRVAGDYLVAADRSRGLIAIAHRLVSATIQFHGDADDTARRLVTLFSILNAYGSLPSRQVVVNREDVTALMVAQGVFPELRAPLPAERLGELRTVLCRLNGIANCAGFQLVQGAQLRIPAVPLNRQPVTTAVTLAGRTVEQVLAQRLYPSDRPSDDDLLNALTRANRSLDQTLDAKLFRLRFTPWDLGSSVTLKAGMPLATSASGFQPAPGAPCARPEVTTALPKYGTGLEGMLQTHRLDHLKSLLGVTGTVEIGVEDAEIVAAAEDGTPGCKAPDTATHVAQEILRTKQVFVRVRDENGAVQHPEPSALQRASETVAAVAPTARPEWSLLLEGPVVLGVRARALRDTPSAQRVGAADQPLRYILGIQEGSLNLPVTGWEPLVAIPAAELRSKSKTRALENRKDPTVQISPHRRSANQSSASSLPGGDRPLNEAQRRAAGERIRRVIKYPDDPPSASGVLFAVAERSKSVDVAHHDFRRPDGQSIWVKRADNRQNLEPVQLTDPAGPAPLIQRDFRRDDDHGTHVAGLLAGLGLPPGVAPQATLFLVPIEDEADEIAGMLDFAANKLASIANFSQTLPTDQDIADVIGGKIDILADRLLVVAATDNRGLPLPTTLLLAPICWSDRPNVIGVAAADDTGQILGTSDTGKKYVQLLAAGKEILSLAKGAYAAATGSSQAAPLVAGAAGLIVAAGQKDPAQIKARLIATADWNDAYREKVWGGFLNVQRAVSHLVSNVLTRLDNTVPMSVAPEAGARIRLKRSTLYSADPLQRTAPKDGGEIEFARVLRIVRQHWLPENHRDRDLFRVVYIGDSAQDDTNQLLIRENVSFEPNQAIRLTKCLPLNAPPAADARGALAPVCEPLRLDQIQDYVAQFPGITPLTFK